MGSRVPASFNPAEKGNAKKKKKNAALPATFETQAPVLKTNKQTHTQKNTIRKKDPYPQGLSDFRKAPHGDL